MSFLQKCYKFFVCVDKCIYYIIKYIIIIYKPMYLSTGKKEMIFDDTIKNLIKAAFNEEKDVFLRLKNVNTDDICFDDVPSVIFLPSEFFGSEESGFSDFSRCTSYPSFHGFKKTLFADIRFMGETSFREFLIARKYKRFILPFAECAVKGEYLFRSAYSWIGEFRAECPYYIHVIALFPPVNYSFDNILNFFGCKDVLIIGEDMLPDIKVYETSSAEAKFYYTASEAEKYAYRKTAVYFNSRNEAEAFGNFLSKRGTAFIRYDGSLSSDEKRKALSCFASGEIPLIIATRSFIRETIFTGVERSIFSGIPFSKSHLLRCCDSSLGITVIYCHSDRERNDRISRSLSDTAGDSEIYTERAKNLSEILSFLMKE